MRFVVFVLLVFGSSVLLFSPAPARAEFTLLPSLTVTEIWTDNLFDEEHDKESAFVTRLMPSLTLGYTAARAEVDLTYTPDYRYYASSERGSELVHFLDLRSLLNYRELAYLEVADQVQRVSLDATRDFGEESLFRNQSDRNTFSISPYLELRPSSRSTLRGGYRFVKIDYEEDEGNDKEDSIFFLDGTYDLSDQTTLHGGYDFIDERSTEEPDLEKQDVWIGVRRQMGEDTSWFATIGYTWIEFVEGPEEGDLVWNLGASHDFGVLVGTASVGVTYLEDPDSIILRQERYRLSVSRDWSRSRLVVSAFFADYYDVAIDRLDIRRYSFSSSLRHEFSERWNGAVTVSADKFDDRFEDTWTRRLIGRLELSYLLTEDLTGTLSYFRIDSHSPEKPEDRFETNQIILEARMVF